MEENKVTGSVESKETAWIPPEETYPMWERAVKAIIERFEVESYGLIVSHVELKELMGIEPAQTISDVQKEQLDYLTGLDKIKTTLLEDYNLFLYRAVGNGYEILHPKEQLRKGADYYIKKSQKALLRTSRTLANVDVEMLDFADRELQLQKMSRVAFVKAAFRKRKLPQPKEVEQIE